MNKSLSTFKEQIHAWALDLIDQKIIELKNEIDAVQRSANSDTKSSMGDKYETSRAMAMIEKENLAKQLAVWQDHLKAFRNVAQDGSTEKVMHGSMVITEAGECYYLSSGLGRHLVKDRIVYFISPLSPVGKLLLNCETGDHFSLNNREIRIQNVI